MHTLEFNMARNTLQDAGETFPSIKAPKDQGSNPGAWCLGRDEKEYLIKLLFGDDCREVINEIIANRFHSSGLTGNLLETPQKIKVKSHSICPQR